MSKGQKGGKTRRETSGAEKGKKAQFKERERDPSSRKETAKKRCGCGRDKTSKKKNPDKKPRINSIDPPGGKRKEVPRTNDVNFTHSLLIKTNSVHREN